MVTIGTGAANFDIILQIGQARNLYIDFERYDSTTGTTSDEDITTKTFSLTVKKNKGARTSLFTLTNSNGITVPTYFTNEIRIDFSATNTNQEEGEYYWELRRTDLNAPYACGNLYFRYDAPQ